MELRRHLDAERVYHESEDQERNRSALIRGVYGSGVFKEAEAYHLDCLGDIRGADVLDYGCGAGYSTALLAAREARVVGFDISEVRLGEARAYSNRNSSAPRPALIQCGAEQLPFANASFDAIFGKQVLHHLDLEKALPELARVLRSGGRAAFLEPLRDNPLLEGYRRLTPHLRSPTERALSMQDVQWIGNRFSRWSHREFCLLAVAPALLMAIVPRARGLTPLMNWLGRMDRRLIDAMPWIGRYCWETVIVLER